MQEEIIVENGIKSILQKIFDYYYSYKRTCKTVALGELQLNENYFLVNHMLGEGALYKLNYPKDINVTFDIIGEGNSENADIFSFVSHHVKGLSVVKSIGPNLLKIYKDGDHNYYVYMPVFSRALIYFTNRVSMDNAISATKVDIDISTLTQVGI